jgi:hypothetical protein
VSTTGRKKRILSTGNVSTGVDFVGIGGYGVYVSVPANQWLRLRVDFKGSRFKVLYEGNQVFEVDDSTFREAGMVGLWTKADSVSVFDDVRYGETE